MKNRRMTRWISIGLTAVCISGLLNGCGKKAVVQTDSQEEQEAVLPEEQELTHDYTTVEGLDVEPGTYIAVVVKGLKENTYWEIIHQGVDAAVNDVNQTLGYEGEDAIRVTFEGPADEANEEEQINTLDAVLAENPAALCLAAVEMESCEPQLETARDNGIPVLILDTGVESSMVTAVCQTDNVAAGQAAGEKLCEKLEGHGRIALVSHLPDTETCILRTEGFRKALEQYPDIDLVCVMEQDPLLTAEEQIADMKENHPNLDGIFATNENLTDAVLTVYKDEEVLPVLVGFDNGEEQIRAIKEGREYGCISQNPYSMGYAVVIAALRAAAGEEIDEKIDSGYVWIDQTNIEDPANQIYLYQ